MTPDDDVRDRLDELDLDDEEAAAEAWAEAEDAIERNPGWWKKGGESPFGPAG